MSEESTACKEYGSLFQRRGEAPVNARSQAVTSSVLGVSRVKSSLADLVFVFDQQMVPVLFVFQFLFSLFSQLLLDLWKNLKDPL